MSVTLKIKSKTQTILTMNLFFNIKLLLKILFFKKKKFFPKKNNLVLFSTDFAKGLEKILIGHKNYTIMPHLDEEPIYIGFLFKCLFNPKQIALNYQVLFLKYVKAKFLINWHDNYLKLSKAANLTGTKVIYIQNGKRGNDVFDNEDPNYFIDYYLTQSESWQTYAKKKINTKFFNSGSIKNNQFKLSKLKKVKKIQLVSFYREKDKVKNFFKKKNKTKSIYENQESWEINIQKPLQILSKTIIKFAEKNNLKYEVLLRNRGNSSEENSFFENIGINTKNIKYSKKDVWKQNYINASEDAIIVGDSYDTMSYELFSRRYRVALFSLRFFLTKNKIYAFDWPSKYKKKGLFWTDNPTEVNMMEILDNLLNIKNNEWYKIVNSFKRINKHDFKNKKTKKFLSKIGLKIN